MAGDRDQAIQVVFDRLADQLQDLLVEFALHGHWQPLVMDGDGGGSTWRWIAGDELLVMDFCLVIKHNGLRSIGRWTNEELVILNVTSRRFTSYRRISMNPEKCSCFRFKT